MTATATNSKLAGPADIDGVDTGQNPLSFKAAGAATTKIPSKLDRIERLLLAKGGTTIAAMVAATGWPQHSVRGAMAGVLKKKRGLVITSEKTGGERRYHARRAA